MTWLKLNDDNFIHLDDNIIGLRRRKYGYFEFGEALPVKNDDEVSFTSQGRLWKGVFKVNKFWGISVHNELGNVTQPEPITEKAKVGKKKFYLHYFIKQYNYAVVFCTKHRGFKIGSIYTIEFPEGKYKVKILKMELKGYHPNYCVEYYAHIEP